jgi:F-type H+-transporting ATPase subunit a
MQDISLPATVLFHLIGIPITDGFLGGAIVTVTILAVTIVVARKFSIVPTRVQVAFEMIGDYIMNQLEQAFRSRARAKAFFPLFMTMLIFLIVANQFMLLPFVFEIVYNGADVFRQPTSDLAQPLTLSLMIFAISQYMAIKISPMKHLGNFIAIKPLLSARSGQDVFQGLVDLFIGVLNIVGELAKIVSLAARLFGNIFAGNVMVAVIIGLSAYTQFIVPLPFIVLSVFSGFVQAFVFMLLSIQFVSLAIEAAGGFEMPKKQAVVVS